MKLNPYAAVVKKSASAVIAARMKAKDAALAKKRGVSKIKWFRNGVESCEFWCMYQNIFRVPTCTITHCMVLKRVLLNIHYDQATKVAPPAKK